MGKWRVVLCFVTFALVSAEFFMADYKEKDWWETASFYQIYPRSFKDSNGDGIGDLGGVTEKLPYLKSLGINATWLSPIFKSPMADFGYDISDFFDIQPEYGTMQDFEKMLKKAKEVGVKLILDFVPNHSSDKNEWFIKSAAKDPEFKDFYVWHPGYPDPKDSTKRVPPNNWLSVFRGSGWTWNEQRKEYYYHAFAVQQPDLNYRNPKVVEMMKSVLRFWLEKGVDGFRVDAVPHLFEIAPDADGSQPDEPLSGDTDDSLDYGYLKHIYTQNQPETFDMVYQWREVLDKFKEEHGGDTRVMLTEAYEDIETTMKFYSDGKGREGAHIPMNFFMIMNLNRDSNAKDFKAQIDIWMDNMPKGRTANWVIGNHDQRRVSNRLGPERIDLMNMVDLCLPGASITYNGEEIGMRDVWISWEDTRDPQACNTDPVHFDGKSRDPARTPFQWDSSTSAGFSTNPNTWLPVSPNYEILNVKIQEQVKRSHLKVYRKLIQLRQQDTFKYGDLETFSVNDDNVLILVRSIDSSFDTFVLLANIGHESQMVDLTLVRDFPPSLQYAVVTSESPYEEGEKVSSKTVHLFPNEGMILRASASDQMKLLETTVYQIV